MLTVTKKAAALTKAAKAAGRSNARSRNPAPKRCSIPDLKLRRCGCRTCHLR